MVDVDEGPANRHRQPLDADSLEAWNPLNCHACHQRLESAVWLGCHHPLCLACVPASLACPLCRSPSGFPEARADRLLRYLLSSSAEAAESCANCEGLSRPMFFCETCRQALCRPCKEATHQAKMFSAHRLVAHSERSGGGAPKLCADHAEPAALFSVESKRLICIKCFQAASLQARTHCLDIPMAHKLGCDRMETAARRVREFQEELRDAVSLHRRLLAELDEAADAQTAEINTQADTLIQAIETTKERLLDEVSSERMRREEMLRQQLRQLQTLLPPTHVYLLGASVLRAAGRPCDLLDLGYELMRRMAALTAAPPAFRPDLPALLCKAPREEMAAALEPLLGVSSLLLPVVEERRRNSSESPASLRCAYSGSGRRFRRSGSGGAYVAHPGASSLYKYQLLVDLSGAFGEEFAKVEEPWKRHGGRLDSLSRCAQELQRDLTARRCLVPERVLGELIRSGRRLEGDLAAHTLVISAAQEQMQLLWQEQLDRVRRQQILFRDQVDGNAAQRERVRQLLFAATHLGPFLTGLSRAAELISPGRTLPPPPAPMESICGQITSLCVDVDSRMQAIEEGESARRRSQAEEQRLATAPLHRVIRELRSPQGLKKKKAPAAAAGRDRSRGGTDPAGKRRAEPRVEAESAPVDPTMTKPEPASISVHEAFAVVECCTINEPVTLNFPSDALVEEGSVLVPAPPTLPADLSRLVEPSTLAARAAVLASLKATVPRISPERHTDPTPPQ